MITTTLVQAAHAGQLLPPQSTPVSSPFWMPSLQVGVGEAPQALELSR
ncbi:MAG: hypothetical protein R2795_12055 [Saprospiraceae bacterium]